MRKDWTEEFTEWHRATQVGTDFCNGDTLDCDGDDAFAGWMARQGEIDALTAERDALKAERDDLIVSEPHRLQGKAMAWDVVCSALDKVSPKWASCLLHDRTGMQCAVNAILDMGKECDALKRQLDELKAQKPVVWACEGTRSISTAYLYDSVSANSCSKSGNWIVTPLFKQAKPADERCDALKRQLDELKAQEPFQLRVAPWMEACFGAAISKDSIERNHRFLEESLELVQALGCTESEAKQLVAYVYQQAVQDERNACEALCNKAGRENIGDGGAVANSIADDIRART